MNKAILIGNMTKDPDLRHTGSGISVCTFTLAVQRRYTDSNGERRADFIPVICWRGTADNVAKYMRKGSKVGVVGVIQVRSYEANDGSRRYVTEVIANEVEFCDGGNRRGGEDDIDDEEYINSIAEEIDVDELPF